MRDIGRTLAAGVLLAILRKPPAAWRLRPGGHFWALLPLLLALAIAGDRMVLLGEAADFQPEGLYAVGLDAVLLLLAASVIAAWAKQRVLGYSIAVHASAAALVSGLVLSLAWWLLDARGLLEQEQVALGFLLVSCFWWLLILQRVLDLCLPDWSLPRRNLGALAAAALSLSPLLLEPLPFWYPSVAGEDLAWMHSPGADERAQPERRARGSAEALIYQQPERIATALESIESGVPGRVDAYLLAFGGDANEDVFRNEVEYASALFAQRFGMEGRTLALLNNPDTTDSLPLATLSNLRLALQGLARRMDPQEDLLILFMTSHGSEEHEFHVDLAPLPLDGIRPEDLRAALDESGILWRVAIISACYSGGFIEPLASPTTLVISAARPDRSSFGCGTESEITWFGRAFLAEALNETIDLSMAFELARERIAEREREQEYEPSEPQIAIGALIGPRLQSWSSKLEAGAPLDFLPVVPVTACRRSEPCAE